MEEKEMECCNVVQKKRNYIKFITEIIEKRKLQKKLEREWCNQTTKNKKPISIKDIDRDKLLALCIFGCINKVM